MPPGHRFGLTLAEVMVVLAVVAILAAMLAPSLAAAREQSRRAACAALLRQSGVALAQYAAAHAQHRPPFAFSDFLGNLPLSGQWGGYADPADPGAFGRKAVCNVNLQALAAEGFAAPGHLRCPSSPPGEGYFADNSLWSSYALRMPHSLEVFRDEPELACRGGGPLLGVYALAGSGWRLAVGTSHRTVPYAPLDVVHWETDPSDGSAEAVDLMAAPVAADGFWYRGVDRPAPPAGRAVRAAWLHGRFFNVLLGQGAVRGVVAGPEMDAWTVWGDQAPPDDGAHGASYAVKAWRALSRP